MRTGTGTVMSQSPSRMRTVRMTWRSWRQMLMRPRFFAAFVPG